MPGYQAFSIHDLASGFRTNRDPWLLPKDAFEEMQDCYLRRGVLEKRRGFRDFGTFGTQIGPRIAETLATGDGTDKTFNGTLGTLTVIPGNISITATMTDDSVETITATVADPTILAGNASSDPAAGTINYTTGVWTLTYDGLAPKTGEDIDAVYHQAETDPIMGLPNYFNSGTDNLLAFNYTVGAKYNTSTKYFEDIRRYAIHFDNTDQAWVPTAGDIIEDATTGATGTVEAVVKEHGSATPDVDGWITLVPGTLAGGTFDSGNVIREKTVEGKLGVALADGANVAFTLTSSFDTNFYWTLNWDDIAYISNDKDRIHKWDGSALVPFHIDLSTPGGTGDSVDRCKLMFIRKSRMILAGTVEDGTAFPRRIRWSNVNSPGFWDADAFVDAETDDEIVGGGFIGDEIILYYKRSTWRVGYTGDSDAPFTQVKISDREGSSTQMGVTPIPPSVDGVNFLATVGPTSLVATDARDVREIDLAIPDYTLSLNLDALDMCYATVMAELEQIWFLVPSVSATTPDTILIYNYIEKNWATMGIAGRCLGQWRQSEAVILDDIVEVLDDLDYSFDDVSQSGGYPMIVMGDNTGNIRQMHYAGTDDGEDISFHAITARLNPYQHEGFMTDLGWIDFLIDEADTISFNVDFFADFDRIAAYQTSAITASDDDGRSDKSKTLKRLNVNAIADTHSLKIYNDASANMPRIHAMIFYFRRAGRMI